MKAKISILSLISTIVFLISCNKPHILAIQNCFGEKINVEIEFETSSKEYSILPEIKDSLKGNTLNITLDYPSKLDLIETNLSILKNGLPLKYLKITRLGEDKILEKGQNIESKMDRDVIGEISCCPYIICI